VISRRAVARAGLVCALSAALSGCATVKYYRGKAAERDGVIVAPQVLSASQSEASPPAGMQYLYGSGEGAAASIQAFRALLDYVQLRASVRPAEGAVLAEGSTFSVPRFLPCGDRPFAVIFDVDETLVLNLGFEYFDARVGRGSDDRSWTKWEQTGETKVAPVPGAVYAVDLLRRLNIKVVFNSNRASENAEQTRAVLRYAGLGTAVHGETLFLKGDDAMGSRKDGRRWTIAERYCVLAMVGDQLGDFSDLYAGAPSIPSRRAAATDGELSKMWGNGWFLLPNPVYGSALKGDFDDVFPVDKRWGVPTAKEAK